MGKHEKRLRLTIGLELAYDKRVLKRHKNAMDMLEKHPNNIPSGDTRHPVLDILLCAQRITVLILAPRVLEFSVSH